MLNSGERQVAPTRSGIRRDHVARYEFAANLLRGKKVIDMACGIGYGTQLLAQNGCTTIGIDRDEETVSYANAHYGHHLNMFYTADASSGVALPQVDAAVCFEAIEHIEDPRPLLRSLHCAVEELLVSVPNEEVFPYAGYAFHYRHYTRAEFSDLLQECGWQPVEWYGQEGPESEVERDVNGRTLIARCQRIASEDSKPVKSSDQPGKAVGKHITILGLGPSLGQYAEIAKRLGGRKAFSDEVWGINALGDIFKCDRIFHMDDVRVQERRAEAAPQSNIARMVDWLKTTDTPVMTSYADPAYPSLEEFPLEDILNELGHGYLNNTAAYALAYAIYEGASMVSIFGCDYTYPNSHDAERGRGCLEFWIGYARARGIKVQVPQTSSLLDAMHSPGDRLYGYDGYDVTVHEAENGRLIVEKHPKELPTADEIEARYDHSAHPNALVKAPAA